MGLTLSELQQEAEWRRCVRDVSYFLRTYWHIEHPTHGAILFDLFDFQEESLQVFATERRVLVLKARQIGYTTVLAAYMFWLCYFQPHKSVIALSKGEREAQEIVKKVDVGIRYLPAWMKARGPKMLTDNLGKKSWANGSEIESLPSKDDPARGRTASLVVLDEWAFYANPETAWASAMPVADVGGQIIALSTANGAGTLFEKQWVKAKLGQSRFKGLFFPWSVRRERDQAWYEDQKRDMLEWQLHQEFPSNDVECFIKSGMSVFDTDELSKIITAPGFKGYLEGHPGARRCDFVEHEQGPLEVWAQPERGTRYVIGVDVAEGQEFGDYSSVHVIDTRTGLVVAHWHGHIAPDLLATDVLWYLGWRYGCALMGVEMNNMGIATALALQNMGYPNLYYRTTLDERTKKQSRKVGWRTQVNTKGLMIAELAKAIRPDATGESEVKLRCALTIAELMTFVREADGRSMHGSPFDDRTISLAIANQMRQFAFTPMFDEDPSPPEWSIEWFAQLGEDDDHNDGLVHVGRHSVRA